MPRLINFGDFGLFMNYEFTRHLTTFRARLFNFDPITIPSKWKNVVLNGANLQYLILVRGVIIQSAMSAAFEKTRLRHAIERSNLEKFCCH